jgi:hypothetical protein
MEQDRERAVTGPSGTLADRVGDHVAAANQLLRQSRQAVERLTVRVEQTHRRVEQTLRRVQDAAADTARVRHEVDGRSGSGGGATMSGGPGPAAAPPGGPGGVEA